MFCPKCGIQNPENGKFCRSCGTNLSNVLAVVNGTASDVGMIQDKNTYVELYSTGVRNTILGAGFLVTSVFLFTLPGNTFFWLLAMIPAFCLVASGVRRILKSEAMKKQNVYGSVPQFSPNHPKKQLAPTHNDYVKPQKSIYETDEMHDEPLSVTEDTTRQLQLSLESETINLPKK